MDESKKESNFAEEYENSIDDLNIDNKIAEIEETNSEILNKIKNMVRHLQAIKNNSEFEEYSQKLSYLVKKLIQTIEKNDCKDTKQSLCEIFDNVETTTFFPQIKILNNALKK